VKKISGARLQLTVTYSAWTVESL